MRPAPPSRRSVLAAARGALALAPLAGACGGGGDDAPTLPPPPTVATVTVALAAPTVAVGATVRATAMARSAAGAEIAGRPVRWTSGDTTRARVADDGTVTGRAAGAVQITATVDGRVGTAGLTITAPAPAARGDTLFSLPAAWSPTEVVVPVGGYVAFVFQGGIDHNAIFRDRAADPRPQGAPDDIPIVRNTTVTRTFARAGTYVANCTVHPGMTARIVVQP